MKSKDAYDDEAETFLKFVNNSDQPINVYWLGYKGEATHYKTLNNGRSYVQSTYETHAWRGTFVFGLCSNFFLCRFGVHSVTMIVSLRPLRPLSLWPLTYLPTLPNIECFYTLPAVTNVSGKVLRDYRGTTATITIAADASTTVIPGLHIIPFEPCPHPTNPEYGMYRQRDTVCGMTIAAYDCVGDAAIAGAKELIQHMLAGVRPAIIERMVGFSSQIAIIGRNQVTTDIPQHMYLKGSRVPDGRDYDEGTRGLGATLSRPVMSVGEENVLMLPPTEGNMYVSESILVHEFAHSVMSLGLHKLPEMKAIHLAFENAHRQGLYEPTSYVALNPDEYWAECTQAWFEATIRQDATSGVITRKLLKTKDPLMATIMTAVWGDLEWRYHHTAPAPLRHKSKSSKGEEDMKRKRRRLWFLPFLTPRSPKAEGENST